MSNFKELKNIQIIILGICIAGATIFSTVILSRGLLKIKKFSNEIIKVTGSAEKNIVSDYIVWNSMFTRRDIKITDAFTQLKNDLKEV
ncbi:MAG: hypothetical protein KAJ14_01435, partial [Candidatus Omnitrophica bacterium]|nr:hypothetical protein [Candidatus Omnitrophota bacterium]